VTHPEMVRYFMTIPEASQLVLQAGGLGDNGSVYVLDMGKPVKIVDLAWDLIRLSGFTPGVDMMVRFTGTRPGEKRYEELEGLISDQEIIAQKEQWQKYVKEHARLSETVEVFRRYKEVTTELEQAQEMLQGEEEQEMQEYLQIIMQFMRV